MKLCECGCGAPTKIATQTRRNLGHVKGQPVRFIAGHSSRVFNGNYNGGRCNHKAGYIYVAAKNHPRASKRGYVFEHTLVAEKVLGRHLPALAEVHHINGVKDDNRTSNLVICENAAYHALLHARLNAYRATGNPDARQCCICHEYDVGLVRRGRASLHSDCRNQYNRYRYRMKKREPLTAVTQFMVDKP